MVPTILCALASAPSPFSRLMPVDSLRVQHRSWQQETAAGMRHTVSSAHGKRIQAHCGYSYYLLLNLSNQYYGRVITLISISDVSDGTASGCVSPSAAVAL